jgi:hypothetical protein
MWLVYIAFALAALPLLVAPILIYFFVKLPTSDFWVDWDIDEGSMAKIASRAKEIAAQDLAPLGFEIVGGIQAATPKVDAYEVHCGHHNTIDRVSISTMFLKPLKQEKVFVEFHTNFEDGSLISTSNADLLDPSFVPRPGCHEFQFTEVDDMALLFRLHRVAVERYGTSKVAMSWKERVLAERRNAEENSVVQHQVACGRFKQDQDGILSPTLSGAFLMGWHAAFPLVQIRRAIRSNKRQQLYKRLPASV